MTLAFPQESRASASDEKKKAIQIILKMEDIDLINTKVPEYPEFKEILIGAAVTLTIKKGSPVQFEYAKNNYSQYLQSIEAPYKAVLSKSKNLILKSEESMLFDKNYYFQNHLDYAVLSGSPDENKKSFLDIFNVPDLQEEISEWIYINDNIVPLFPPQPYQSSTTQRTAQGNQILKVLANRDMARKPHFTKWINNETAFLASTSDPKYFFGDADIYRERKVIAETIKLDNELGFVDAKFIESVWALFIQSFGSMKQVGEIWAFLELMRETDQLSWTRKHLPEEKLKKDLFSEKTCDSCDAYKLSMHYLSTLFFKENFVDLASLESILLIIDGWGIGGLIGERVNPMFEEQCRQIMLAKINEIKAEIQLQEFLDKFGKYYYLDTQVKSAFDEKKIFFEKAILAKLKKTTWPKGRYKAEKKSEQYTIEGGSYCAREDNIPEKVCLDKSASLENLFGGCPGNLYTTEWRRGCVEWGSYPDSYGTNYWYEYTLNVSFPITNPSKVKIEVGFGYTQNISFNLTPPTSITLEAEEKSTISKSESATTETSGIVLKSYYLDSVRILLNGEYTP